MKLKANNTNAQPEEQEKYYPIIVRIEYELVDPDSGIYFNMPDPEAAPYVSINIMHSFFFFYKVLFCINI